VATPGPLLLRLGSNGMTAWHVSHGCSTWLVPAAGKAGICPTLPKAPSFKHERFETLFFTLYAEHILLHQTHQSMNAKANSLK